MNVIYDWTIADGFIKMSVYTGFINAQQIFFDVFNLLFSPLLTSC